MPDLPWWSYAAYVVGMIFIGWLAFKYDLGHETGGKVPKDLFLRPLTADELKELSELTGRGFREFHRKVREEDEVWLWRTPQWTWEQMCGREGYVIVRRGRTTRYSVITVMN